jgi:hypothetical protein
MKMNITVDDLVEQAKQLAPAEQAALSERILELVSPHEREWQEAWTVEARSRMEAYRRGEIEAYDFDEVMEEMRVKYDIK